MCTQQLLTLSMIASMVFASGCSSMAADNKQMVAGSDSASLVELQAAQQRVADLEATLAERDSELASTEARFSNSGEAGSGMMGSSSAESTLFPPNPKAGECYARVLIPAKFRSVSDRVLTREASERIEVSPARYENAEERVLIREASTKLEIVPAVYGEAQERVLIKPASKTITEIPAKYDTVSEQVIDKPARTGWKKGPAALQAGNVLSQTTNDTGEIMCLVEIPATYKAVSKRVLVSPARTEVKEIPAQYKTVTKRVVEKPATTRQIEIPAEYDTVKVTKLVAPAAEKRIAIPAEYDTVARNEKVTDERMEWHQVMCEVNMTRNNVIALQQALTDAGYYNSGIDGVIGGQTLNAARAYAAANNLPAGSNYIPMEVIKKLNVKI